MRKIDDHGGAFWMGIHDTAHLVIFDPAVQQGLSDIWVRIYVVNESRFGQFTKEKFRESLSEPSALGKFASEHTKIYESAIDNWKKLRSKLVKLKGRRTWCHSCKRELDSYGFPWCEKCHWIKCGCGSCGCNHELFHLYANT